MSSIMKYKGYFTRVQYSDEDKALFGVIEGIDDTISFEAQSVPEFEKAFHDAVEDYLSICAEIGKEPQKAYKGSFNVRISTALHRAAAEAAAALGTTLNDFVEKAISSYVVHMEVAPIQRILWPQSFADNTYKEIYSTKTATKAAVTIMPRMSDKLVPIWKDCNPPCSQTA